MNGYDSTLIRIAGYSAERRGDHWSVWSRGFIIGALDALDGLWRATSSAIGLQGVGEIMEEEPEHALRVFLERGGYLTRRPW